jgi:hypothetical protein
MGRRIKAPMKDLSDALEGRMTPRLVARLQEALTTIDSNQARIAQLAFA